MILCEVWMRQNFVTTLFLNKLGKYFFGIHTFYVERNLHKTREDYVKCKNYQSTAVKYA